MSESKVFCPARKADFEAAHSVPVDITRGDTIAFGSVSANEYSDELVCTSKCPGPQLTELEETVWVKSPMSSSGRNKNGEVWEVTSWQRLPPHK